MVTRSPSLSTWRATRLPLTNTPLVLLQVLDGGVHRAGQQHRVVAADVLGIEHQLVVGAAADARAAAEHVHEIGIAVGADQHARRAFERDFFAGLRGAVER